MWFFFSSCWRLTTPLTYPNSIHPWRTWPVSLASVLFTDYAKSQSIFQSNTQLSAWFCAFSLCLLIFSWVKICPPKRISNSLKAEAVMPPDGMTRFPWKKSGNLGIVQGSLFGYTSILWLDYWYYIGQGAMAWLGWTIWQLNSRL